MVDGMRTRPLLVCGAVAGPLFLVALFVEGATRAHYSALRDPGSSLELGPYGWIQQLNFAVAGLLTLAFAVGLRSALRPGRGSRWVPILVGIWAVGLIGAGVFVTDPVAGHPTWHGRLHDLLSLPGFVALWLAFLVLARRWGRVYSIGTAVVFAVSFGLSGAAFQQTPGLVAVGGLCQRVAAVAGWAWLTLVALWLLRRPDRQPPAPPPPAAVLARLTR
jgi:hypothetical membrane protein